jgi:serine/threonine-protein kinase
METEALKAARVSTVSQLVDADVDLHPGEVLGERYEILDLIGEGGMGRIFSARHVVLGHLVAVKLVRADACKPHLLKRFRDEGCAVARLQSEHVARVLDIGEHEATGMPYLVLEHLEGRDLADVIADPAPTAPEQAVAWLLEACEALAEAHRIGIVHRDVKPQNLFLANRRMGPPIVKLIDFGVAKLMERADDFRTAPELVIGTPHYMSPEQVRGADVDARADVWALGVVLFELLTKKVPFDGPTPGNVVAAILSDGTPSLKSYRSDVPEGMQRVIERCLAKDREERYETVADMASALAEFAPGAAALSLPRIRTNVTVTPAVPRTTASAVERTVSSSTHEGFLRRHGIHVAMSLVAVLVGAAAGRSAGWAGAREEPVSALAAVGPTSSLVAHTLATDAGGATTPAPATSVVADGGLPSRREPASIGRKEERSVAAPARPRAIGSAPRH